METNEGIPLAILVIDDDADVARSIVQLLAGHGFSTWTIGDPQRAVEDAEKRQPDIIILDFDMPKMLGSDVSVLLKGKPQTRDIPIIFLSGMTDEDTRTIAKVSGAAAFLEKPFKERELLEAIRNLTAGH